MIVLVVCSAVLVAAFSASVVVARRQTGIRRATEGTVVHLDGVAQKA